MDDNYHYYWGDAQGKRFHCACGIRGDCIDPSKYCNCDARQEGKNKIIEDKGYLTIIEHLPLMRIEYFDVNSDDGSEAISSIGALECYGWGETIFQFLHALIDGFLLCSSKFGQLSKSLTVELSVFKNKRTSHLKSSESQMNGYRMTSNETKFHCLYKLAK